MFLRLCQTNELVKETSARENALLYINRAKRNAKHYSRSRDERCAFLCGNAGIYAVSSAISYFNQQNDVLQRDLGNFENGFEACKPVNFSKYGSDELLVGRAGFLSNYSERIIFESQIISILTVNVYFRRCLLVE